MANKLYELFHPEVKLQISDCLATILVQIVPMSIGITEELHQKLRFQIKKNAMAA